MECTNSSSGCQEAKGVHAYLHITIRIECGEGYLVENSGGGGGRSLQLLSRIQTFIFFDVQKKRGGGGSFDPPA